MHTHTLTSGRRAAPLVGCAPAAQAMHCEAPVACCMYPSGHVVQDVDPLLAANVPSCGGCTNSGSTARVSEAVGEAMIGTLGKAGWVGQAGAVGELRAVGGARACEHAMRGESSGGSICRESVLQGQLSTGGGNASEVLGNCEAAEDSPCKVDRSLHHAHHPKSCPLDTACN